MFTTRHYVPILKAKEGEFRALQETSSNTKDVMTPLFEIVNISWDYEDDAEAKTIDAHLSKMGKKMMDFWGEGRRHFVDSNLIDNNRLMGDGTTHHLVSIFNDFRSKNLEAVPVTGLNRSSIYKQAVLDIYKVDKKGICLRLQNANLGDANLKKVIDEDLAFYQTNAGDIDLVIDIESIGGTNADLLVLTLTTFINTALPYIQEWKSLTLAGTGFPSDLRDIDADSIDSIDRSEWALWLQLYNANLQRRPSFGDYGIANPEVLEMDPRNMRVSASIRYTFDTYWVIVRGKWLRKYGFDQYHNLCSNLILRPEYSGAGYSWADNYINDCAANTVGTGSATTWRKVGNNHHFQKVVDQVSNLA